jgi:tight adherence protein C
MPGSPVWPAMLVAATAAGLLVLGLALFLADTAPLSRRARAMAPGARALGVPAAGWSRVRGWVGRRLSRVSLPHWVPAAPTAQLQQAGLRGREALLAYSAVALVAPVALAAAGGLFGPLLFGAERGAMLGVAGGGLLGVAAPGLWLRNAIATRQALIRAGFPDMLDLFVICVEAGLSLDAAMARVANELRPATPALAQELGLTAVELGFLPNRADAFANLERRVPMEEVTNLVTMLEQTERYGTPLAQALRAQAADARAAALLRVEERAARLPAILTVPMILFILPPLFIVLIGPVIVQLLGR